jgi:hypothetical protein
VDALNFDERNSRSATSFWILLSSRLADVHRREPHLLPDALPWACRHAAPHRRLSRRLCGVEFRRLDRLLHLLRRPDRFLFGIAQAFARKQHAASNPWGVGAATLEWTLPSPPNFHSYETLPRIKLSSCSTAPLPGLNGSELRKRLNTLAVINETLFWYPL